MFKSPLARAAAVAAFAATFVACGSSTEPKTPPRDNKPATITSTTTGALTGQAGATLNTLLSVVVKNAAGQGADTALVTFAVTGGGGSVSNTTVRTDSTGVASTTWTLGGTAGTQTVTASVGGLPAVTFTATATAANATAITKVAGDNQTAAAGANVATAPSVKIADKFGNPVANILVNFAAATGGGSVTGASVNTDANGIATIGSWRLGATVGANTLTATSINVGSVTFTATGTVGAVSRVTITSAAIPTLSVGQTATVTASAFDAGNNPVPNPGITFSSSNTAVATVNATSGLVTAVGSGTANIIATANGVTASTPVTVIGHPGITTAKKVLMAARPVQIVSAGSNVFAALGIAGAVASVSTVTDTIVWNTVVNGNVVGLGVNSSGSLVVAASTGGGNVPTLYLLNGATGVVTDSIALTNRPQKMVLNSTGTRAYVIESDFNMETIDIGSKTIINRTSVPGTMVAMTIAPNDQFLYAATRFDVLEVSATSGTVTRTFSPSSTIATLSVSKDSKTLIVADGTPDVKMIRLATGGLNGTASFGAVGVSDVSGATLAPDNSQLWASIGNTMVAAPSDGAGNFDTGLVQGRITVDGTHMAQIVFLPTGSAAVAIDDAGNNLVIFQ